MDAQRHSSKMSKKKSSRRNFEEGKAKPEKIQRVPTFELAKSIVVRKKSMVDYEKLVDGKTYKHFRGYEPALHMFCDKEVAYINQLRKLLFFQKNNQCQESYIKANPIFQLSIKILEEVKNAQAQDTEPDESCSDQDSDHNQHMRKEKYAVEDLKENHHEISDCSTEDGRNKFQSNSHDNSEGKVTSNRDSYNLHPEESTDNKKTTDRKKGRSSKRDLLKKIYTEKAQKEGMGASRNLAKSCLKLPPNLNDLNKRERKCLMKKVADYKLGTCVNRDKLPLECEKVSRFISRAQFKGGNNSNNFRFTNPSERCLRGKSVFKTNSLLSLSYSTLNVDSINNVEKAEIILRKELDAVIRNIFRIIVFSNSHQNWRDYQYDAFPASSIILKDMFCFHLRCACFEILVNPLTKRQSNRVHHMKKGQEVFNHLLEFGEGTVDCLQAPRIKTSDHINLIISFPMVYSCSHSPIFLVTIVPLSDRKFQLLSVKPTTMQKGTARIEASIIHMFLFTCKLLKFEGITDIPRQYFGLLKCKEYLMPSSDGSGIVLDEAKNYRRVCTVPGDFDTSHLMPLFVGDYADITKLPEKGSVFHNTILQNALILCFEALIHKSHQKLFVCAFKTLRNYLEEGGPKFELLDQISLLQDVYSSRKLPSIQANDYIKKASSVFKEAAMTLLKEQGLPKMKLINFKGDPCFTVTNGDYEHEELSANSFDEPSFSWSSKDKKIKKSTKSKAAKKLNEEQEESAL